MRTLIILGLSLVQVGHLCAQGVGDEIVVISLDASIMSGKTEVDRPPAGAGLIVREINGDWFGLSRGWPGDIRRNDVVAFDQALSVLNRRVSTNPNNDSWKVARAHHLCDLKRWDEAISDYTDAIRLSPRNSAAFVGRGNAWSRKEAYEWAVRDYSDAIRLTPDSVIAHYDRGLAWAARTRYDDAIVDFSSAIRLSPTYSKAYEGRGTAFFNKMELGKAYNDAIQAIRHDPKSPSAFALRGLIRRRRGEYDESLEDFEQAMRLAPKTGGIYVADAASTFGVGGRYKEQKRFLEELLESGSPDLRYDVLTALAACSRSLREFEAALRYMEKAAELKPEDPSTLYALAIMQKNAGRVDLALTSYERARGLTKSPRMRTSLDVVIAGYRIHAGKRESGLHLFELVEADAKRLGMHVNIAWFYAVAEKDKEFFAAFEQALRIHPESALNWAGTEVDIDRYRSDPRFKNLIARYRQDEK